MNYIPLNIKTEYDLMNSLIKIDDLLLYAESRDVKALGITDSSMFGTMEFITKCNLCGIKPIVGCELIIEDAYVVLYARNYDGLVSLFKLVSKKNIDGVITFEDVEKYISNLIVVTSIRHYEVVSKYFNDCYLKFHNEKTKEEALKLTKNIVYMDLIRYFEPDDIEYFKYIRYIDEGKVFKEKINVYESGFKNNIGKEYTKSTFDFANLINIELPPVKTHIPVYREDSKEFLFALAKKGLEKRLNGDVPEVYKNRLMYELSVIEKMNFVDYFLIVYDFVLFAKRNNILVGPGRGSGAASLVNYSLGIINVDPLKYNLIFERFLNPDRVTMPDIDIDFDSLKREEVIKYVSDKYGHKNTARIISFNTLLPKQVIRDTARVMELNQILVDNICRTIKDEKTFDELKNNFEFNNIVRRNKDAMYLVKVCDKLCGLKKNTSMHAAGVVISDIELDSIMPLYKVGDTVLTGYSMEYIESLGLLKMDFLSIKNLNTISNIIDDIRSSGINIDINNIDLNDKRTLYLFSKAYTTGVFQFESSGMKAFLKELEVDSFHTLVDAIALYRPGPREMIPTYIKRKKGLEKVTYLIPELEPILKSTYGIIVYQEQVLEILRNIGGYSYAEADIIRRAMSKKKESVIASNKDKFINGVISHGHTKEVGEELYQLIIKFSSYGFNKSHSVVYSVVAFQMAYLKINYTLYFMKNLLNMNKSTESIKEYIDESKILGIEFLPMDINKSCKEFIISDNKLVIPFTIIKSIASTVSEEIENERSKGLFKDFYDFMIRCYSKSVNKRVVIALIECGAFDKFGINKKSLINSFDEVLNYVTLCKDLNIVIDEKPILEDIEDYTDREIIENEIINYGFYLSFHPVTKVDRSNSITLKDFTRYFDKVISCILYVESVKTIKTKNGEKMSFIKLSDEFRSIEGVVFPDAYKKIGEIKKNYVYKINAKVEKKDNTYQLIVYNMINLG